MGVALRRPRDSDDDHRLLIISVPTRTWWRNLRGGQTVGLLLRGRDAADVARVAPDKVMIIVTLTD